MDDGSYPADIGYHAGHGWVRVEGDIATFGITWFAQDQLGEVVFFDPPQPGDRVRAGEPYAEVDSLKAVSDVIAPLGGEVVEVNDEVAGDPTLVNSAAEGAGWLVKVRFTEEPELLDEAAYRELTA